MVAVVRNLLLLLLGLGGITTVKALQAVMYRDMQGWGGAYKLLNATDTIGSQGATRPQLSGHVRPSLRPACMNRLAPQQLSALVACCCSTQLAQSLCTSR
jgi:hypothetical protein